MRVLFVSGIDGACHRYQVLHRAAQLESRGVQTRVRCFVDPRVEAEAGDHDVLFLYRVPETRAIRAAIERARAGGALVVGSVDDLIFSPDPAAGPPLDRLSSEERALWLRGVERYRATLEACDAFVAPTEPLVDEAAGLGWTALLHRNALSPAEIRLADEARARAEPRRDQAVLGYLSGTPTHDRDLDSIAPVLAEILGRHPGVRLRLVGPVAVPAALDGFGDRVERLPLVSFPDLPALLASIDVSLAPLDSRSRFARAKGEVRYLEAAAVGTPVVATPTPAFQAAIRDRWNGRLAEGAEPWLEALDELVRDPEARRLLGSRARLDAIERYGERSRAAELVALLGSLRAGPRPPAAGPVEDEPASERALEPDACPALPAVAVGTATPPLGEGVALAQAFRPLRDGLCRIDVHAITYGQALDHELRFRLWRADGTLVAEVERSARLAPDRAWLAFEFEPERSSAGRRYELELSAERTGPGNALSFGIAAGVEEASLEPARLGGRPLAGPLALRAFAAWDRALGRGGRGARP